MLASPAPARPSAFLGVLTDLRDRDAAGVVVPRAELRLVVRMGPHARNGLDVYAMGVRRTVHRKRVHGGQQTVSASLPLHVTPAVLGVAPSELAGQMVALEDVWGNTAAQRLHDQLAHTRDPAGVIQVLDRAVSERLRGKPQRDAHARLALHVADRLAHATLKDIALERSMSERHLRRVFRNTLGVGPKTFAKLERFGRAVRAASTQAQPSWAAIATAAGYYDQAHLIAEFHAIAGATPGAFLRELRAAPPIGWADASTSNGRTP